MTCSFILYTSSPFQHLILQYVYIGRVNKRHPIYRHGCRLCLIVVIIIILCLNKFMYASFPTVESSLFGGKSGADVFKVCKINWSTSWSLVIS